MTKTSIIRTERFNSGNIDWELLIKANSKNGRFTGDIVAELNCLYEYKLSNFWSINAEIELKGWTLYERFERNMEFCFNSSATCLCFGKVAETREGSYFEPTVDNVSANIKFKSSVGIELIEVLDLTIANDANVVLRLADHSFYVDRYGLMAIDSKFREMLSRNHREIEIEGVDHESFLIFLKLLHQRNLASIKLTAENVDGLVAIAKKYDMKFLMADCEELLNSTGFLTTFQKLQIAERHQFSKLQTEVLGKLTKNVVIELLACDVKDEMILQALLAKKTEIEDAELRAEREFVEKCEKRKNDSFFRVLIMFLSLMVVLLSCVSFRVFNKK